MSAQDALFNRFWRLIPAVQGLDALDLLWQSVKAQPNPSIFEEGVEFDGLEFTPAASIGARVTGHLRRSSTGFSGP